MLQYSALVMKTRQPDVHFLHLYSNFSSFAAYKNVSVMLLAA